MRPNRLALFPSLAAAAVLFAAGCGNDSVAPGDPCDEPGETEACDCMSDGVGERECLSSGRWSFCDCGPATFDAGPDEDGGGDAGGDDTGGQDGGGNDTGSDTAVDTGPPSCEAGDPPRCLDGHVQECLADGSGFEVTENCGERGCVNASCRQACADDGDCGSGEACLSVGVGVTACVGDECGGFFADDCGDGLTCAPVANGVDLCVEPGDVGEGGGCSAHGDCVAGAVCTGGRCRTPECDPGAAEVGCDDGRVCLPASIEGVDDPDVGFCATPCAPFGDGSECADDQYCEATGRDEDTGLLTGECRPAGSGTGEAGDACGGDSGVSCQSGMSCVRGGCRLRCDPESATSGEGACGEAQYCTGLVSEGATLPFGACLDHCTAWESDPTAAGCFDTEWCDPRLYDAGLGTCRAADGPGGVGDLCGGDLPRCGPDLLCLRRGGSDAACVQLCNPAGGDAPGADLCGDIDVCERLVLSDAEGMAVDTEVGTCIESCDYDAGIACGSGLTCIPNEVTGPDYDVCRETPDPALAEFASCDVAGLVVGQFCGGANMCLDLSSIGGPGARCYELCRSSEGALGEANHPDCSRATAVCTQVFSGDAFGVCGNDM